MRMGLLGCGLIAQYAHLPALVKADGVELVAVCDLAGDLAERIAVRYGVPCWFDDMGRFLSAAGMDAVLVATADQQHVSNALACLRAGKHVLVEKPLGRKVEECRELARAADELGLQVQVGNMKRYDPGIQFARQFLCERMGQRLSISGWYCDTEVRPLMQASLRPALLRSDRQEGFDPAFKSDKRVYKLFAHGCHLIDTLRFLGGEIAVVEARLAVKYDNYSWHGLLEFSDGAVGHFELTTAVKMDWVEGFRVHGEGGSVEIRSFHPFFNRASEVRVFDARAAEYRSPMVPDGDAYERQLEAFARAVEGGERATPDAWDGVADMAVLEAIRKSVESGGRVEIGR